MKKIRGLFVTHEGFATAIVRTQVIEHCTSLRRLSIELDILTYETFARAWITSTANLQELQRENRGISILLKRAFNIYLPFAWLANALRLAVDLRSLKNQVGYQFIHARAEYTAFLCLVLKPMHRLPVVWDCRGDSVDEMKLSLSGKRLPIRWVLGPLLLARQKLLLRCCQSCCDAAVFVSSSLKAASGSSFAPRPSVVVPCPVPEGFFYFDDECRRRVRDELKVPADATVFLYSGSTTGYQGLQGQVELYRRILKAPKNFVVIATTEVESARAIFQTLESDRLLIRRFGYREMNGIYNAADFAFLLREKRMLNWVASPTKFGEYCLTGLPVIHNAAVQQVTEAAEFLGLGRPVEMIDTVVPSTAEQRLVASVMARTIFGRSVADERYRELYEQLVTFE